MVDEAPTRTGSCCHCNDVASTSSMVPPEGSTDAAETARLALSERRSPARPLARQRFSTRRGVCPTHFLLVMAPSSHGSSSPHALPSLHRRAPAPEERRHERVLLCRIDGQR